MDKCKLLLSVQRVWGKVEVVKKSKVIMDIETLSIVTGYCHWIPVTQGLYKEYFSENFPGWSWNHFVPKLLDLKILQFKGEGSENLTVLRQGLYISSDIHAIEFSPEKSGVKVRVFKKSEGLYEIR